ncbi:immunoglobulin-like domain-containing protein [Heyndrickxia sp. NPDC080065]|uniref:immunoglobulin-like domain-containing protein n=1 Tax=Heyndrickxia sp. NPDC080065 TaxID=3390568 RepID=UPI003D03F99E
MKVWSGQLTNNKVKLVLSKKSYPLSIQNKSMPYKIINDSINRITFGVPVELEIYKNDSGYVIPLVKNATWSDDKKSLNPGEHFHKILVFLFLASNC